MALASGYEMAGLILFTSQSRLDLHCTPKDGGTSERLITFVSFRYRFYDALFGSYLYFLLVSFECTSQQLMFQRLRKWRFCGLPCSAHTGTESIRSTEKTMIPNMMLSHLLSIIVARNYCP